MQALGFRIIGKGCLMFCIMATIGFTSYCLQQFFLNEDTSLVHFRKYHNRLVDIYPAISLCFSNYLKTSVFHHNQGKMMDYKRFLVGMRFDKEFAKLNYENVTMNIKEYIIDAILIKQFDGDLDEIEEDAIVTEEDNENGTAKNNETEELFDLDDIIKWDMNKYLYVSANIDPNYKCWTFEIPYLEKITTYRRFVIRLKKSIFRNSVRPTNEDFKVVISYPGQFLSARVTKSDWRRIPGIIKNELKMEFNIQNMIILRKRDKLNEPCKMETTRDDEDKLKQLVQTVGCRALHINLNTTYPDCLNQELVANASKFYNAMEEYEGPCRQVEKIMYFYDEYEETFFTKDESEKGYELVLNFQGNTFMEIEQVRAYDFQNLIGNGGGYIGVFLGVAVIQLPAMLYKIHNYFYKLF